VIGLYPHIPHEGGMRAMKSFLDARERKSPSSENLCRLADIILKHNYFQFGDQKYHQKTGTAVGTKFAPPYANLFMASLERLIF